MQQFINKQLSFFFLILGFVLLTPSSLIAQNSDLGNWIMGFGQLRFHDNWSIHAEAQYRNHTVAPNIEQLLLRTGLRLHPNKHTTFLLGYGYVSGHDEDAGIGNPKSVESRIYQEMTLNHAVSRFSFEHRYRIEQRWVGDDYRNRFRYRLLASLALNKPKMGPKTYFLAFYDEVFIAPTSTPFDRNRLYGALGYRWNAKFMGQIGLLNQAVSDFNKWYLQFAIFATIDTRKD
ncbi:MAG: DUF2490 domain-containing protein [Bacteroidota bacterium]